MSIPSSINQAKAAASSGNTKAALAILRQVIMQDPRNVDAWLVLADIVEKPEQAKECLERVLQIDPNNRIAQQKLLGKQPLQPQDTASPQMPSPATHLDETRQRALPKQGPVLKKQVQQKKKGFTGTEIAVGSVIGVLCLCLSILGIASLGNSGVLEPEPTSLPEEITGVMYENIRASNAKDYDGYMATIHSNSPNYNATEEGIKTAFSDEFTLSYRLSDVYVIEQRRNKAVVHFVLTTRLIRGPSGFQDNRVTGEMTLRTEDDAWKIYDQKVIEIDYLD